MRIINKSGNEIAYQTKWSAGFDIPANERLIIKVGETKAVSTGLYVDTTEYDDVNWTGIIEELQIRPRSGLALKHGVTVLNSPGTIDCDYPNEIKVILHNFGDKDFIVFVGDRIAQGVVNLVMQVDSVPIKSVVRAGGFGSTGK